VEQAKTTRLKWQKNSTFCQIRFSKLMFKVPALYCLPPGFSFRANKLKHRTITTARVAVTYLLARSKATGKLLAQTHDPWSNIVFTQALEPIDWDHEPT
jgi:hypothetical protein